MFLGEAPCLSGLVLPRHFCHHARHANHLKQASIKFIEFIKGCSAYENDKTRRPAEEPCRSSEQALR